MVAFDSPEGRLIRACVVAHAQERVDDAIDWAALLDAARIHGVSALVAKLCMDRITADVRATLKAELLRSTAGAMVQEVELTRVLCLFEEAGIEALVFKGQPLSVEAYGEIGLRASTDIDVLVRQRDAERAARLLLSSGYRFHEDLTDDEWRRVRKLLSEWMLVGKNTAVDLHWCLTSPAEAFELGTEEVFDEARELDVGRIRVRTLSHEHLALYLAVHGCKHFWERFEWLLSFRAIFFSEGVDRERIRNMAERLGCVRRLTVAERLVERAFHEDGGEARQPVIERVVDEVIDGWFGQLSEPMPAMERLRRNGAMFDRRRDSVRALLTGVFSPRVTDWRGMPLPDSLAFLYPLLRPARLALRRVTRRGGGRSA